MKAAWLKFAWAWPAVCLRCCGTNILPLPLTRCAWPWDVLPGPNDLELDTETRDELEVAALLHDVGKIGVPDRLLLHAGPLAAAETLLMDQHRLSGLDMLATCSPSPAINQIIRYSGGWYDGSRANYPLAGERIPVGARMLAIVDAFDSMTSGQVYRPAMSRERLE